MQRGDHLWLLRRIGAIVTGVFLLYVLAPLTPARADGGAPNLAYIAGSGANGQDLAIIDIAKQSIIAQIPLNGTPAGVVLSSDNRTAWVPLASGDTIAIIDTRNHRLSGSIPVGKHPSGIAINLNGSPTLYSALHDANAVAVVDPVRNRVIRTLPTDRGPVSVALANPGSGISNPAAPELYVANQQGQSVTIFDIVHTDQLGSVTMPAPPLGIVIPATGGVAYVTLTDGSVYGIALATHRLFGPIIMIPHGTFGTMDYDALTGQIYLPDSTNRQVAVLAPVAPQQNGPPRDPIRIYPVSGGATAVAITFDGALGFFGAHDGTVTMIDVPGRKVLHTFPVGGVPVSIITGSYPPLLDSQSSLIVSYLVGLGLLVIIIAITLFYIRRARAAANGTRTV